VVREVVGIYIRCGRVLLTVGDWSGIAMNHE
jgi:hypothetical protein